MFAAEYPFEDPEPEVAAFRTTDLTAEESSAPAHADAERIFSL